MFYTFIDGGSRFNNATRPQQGRRDGSEQDIGLAERTLNFCTLEAQAHFSDGHRIYPESVNKVERTPKHIAPMYAAYFRVQL